MEINCCPAGDEIFRELRVCRIDNAKAYRLQARSLVDFDTGIEQCIDDIAISLWTAATVSEVP
jgi:hypothetical protein